MELKKQYPEPDIAHIIGLSNINSIGYQHFSDEIKNSYL